MFFSAFHPEPPRSDALERHLFLEASRAQILDGRLAAGGTRSGSAPP